MEVTLEEKSPLAGFVSGLDADESKRHLPELEPSTPDTEVPLVPELPLDPELPEVPVDPEEPELPEVPPVPEEPEVPVVPLDPELPEVPEEPFMPLVPEVPLVELTTPTDVRTKE